VPFLDLSPMHAPLRKQVLAAVGEIVDANAFVNGPQVAELEAAFAAYCGTAECVGMASGLDALRIAFMAARFERGDEVIVPADTFVATVEAVLQAGMQPVFADVRDDDFGLDADAAAAAITPRTAAICPVHLYGQVGEMSALTALAKRHGLEIVEDAAQAHGAERDGQRAGTFGRAAAFSFYPGKNLGAMGDAGALVTDDPALAALARALREHGQHAKYVHEHEGYTARLDTIQAAVLLLKLPELDRWNAERAALARGYAERLDGVGDLRLPATLPGSRHVWHLYVVRTAQPEELASFLRERGIGTGRHYPIPAHLAPAYSTLGPPAGSMPVAEALARECLSLPLFPGMSEGQLETVTRAIGDWFD
jgi:dTDP-4-amino-4,6-dideoxygalactose transaminase